MYIHKVNTHAWSKKKQEVLEVSVYIYPIKQLEPVITKTIYYLLLHNTMNEQQQKPSIITNKINKIYIISIKNM